MDLFCKAILLVLLFRKVFCGDSVADGIGPHTIRRIAYHLSPFQCDKFYKRLSGSEEDLKKSVRIVSPGILSYTDLEIVTHEECKNKLHAWFVTKGDTVYLDQFLDELYNVGRMDIAKAIENKMGQKLQLILKKYMEPFQGKTLYNEEDDYLDFIVEQEELPPFNQTLTDWMWPLFNGLIIGFLGGAVLAALIFLLVFSITGIDNFDLDLAQLAEGLDEDVG
ncbi:uncharacterized protein LOC108707687 [Xenopus laevis]|uniref:Uncharacterized protein LOC108707687 n=2 Tax=Xenopus laevis TaxID=8355 RepID=A0A1L8HDX9_XENLA|nr:uncharacterized protein LOC108707687 [Xenopus laevis]XP_041437810.1 uncharacterized protein LOC108707687 [Xenopus laevis]XP_041437811.1 uncharacterized protein LOC108707687 [Xenopus laevis]XP_041437812.1 uncharacterized protein LOC108707687 [Xenopus laevis]OCT94304.1 hypothetical protein XELAEV_18011972mg [Xenopus laevis]